MSKIGNNKKHKYWLVVVVIVAIIALAVDYFSHHTVAVLQPRGPIALQERNLMLTVVYLMLIIVIPVFILTFYIVWKYRDGHKGKYRPDFDHSRALEATWWLIPTALITVLAIITWHATHQLDPYRPIASTTPALSVDVVALDWKWLFIYPNQKIASVNQLNIPVNTPINFYITADAPMNSFWIPQLSGQIYAMPGMSTQLHLEATSTGDFYGSSANISGSGFSGMHFLADATSAQKFNSWVSQVKSNAMALNYDSLTKPSYNNPVSYYNQANPDLYVSIIDKYMLPGVQMSSMMGMQ